MRMERVGGLSGAAARTGKFKIKRSIKMHRNGKAGIDKNPIVTI